MNGFLILPLLFSFAVSAKVTVSGLSSGAYMAQQFHTAFSGSVSGVGVLAGGPYYCAQGTVINGLNRCMKTSMGLPKADDSQKEAEKLEKSGAIDSLQNMKSAKVYLFSGTLDETVLPVVMNVLHQIYQNWGVKDLFYEHNLRVGHAFPTEDFGNNCEVASQAPWISKCGRDIAGEMLAHLIGPLQPKLPARANRLLKFAQPNIPKSGLYKEGFAYVPQACAKKRTCSIHVAFHGCHQSVTELQDKFTMHAGYNEWAEANSFIVLYPQIQKDQAANPNGCWDWWGYASKDYHTKNGVQMKAVMELVKRIQAGTLTFR